MHQTIDSIVARFTFAADRAHEFLGEKDPVTGKIVYNGQLVSQIECESIDQVMEFLTQFGDAILDCSAIVNGQVVSLSDHPQKD